VPDNPTDDLSDRHVLGLGFGLDAGNERPLDVQGPSLGGGVGLVRLGQQVLAPAPPGQQVANIRSSCVTVGDHTLH
jgi:hypothetical protein